MIDELGEEIVRRLTPEHEPYPVDPDFDLEE